MGCDIHSYAERKTSKGYEIIDGLHPLDWRSYGLFGFLAGVRNYSAVTPIVPRRGYRTIQAFLLRTKTKLGIRTDTVIHG